MTLHIEAEEIMNNLIRRAACVVAFTACFALPALADSVTFTDLGSGGSYNGTSSAYSVLGVNNTALPGAYQSVADPFTASISGTLSQIDLGLGHVSGTNSAVVSIYTDVSNNLGTLVFSGTVFNQPAFDSSSTILATLSATAGILVAGDDYYLVVAPGAADTADAWNFNNTGATGTILFDNGSGFNDSQPDTLQAFDVRVNATTVPEPSSWLTLGAELLCLLAVASWKRSLSVR